MWGAKLNQSRNTIQGMMKALIDEGQEQSKGRDQDSLKKIVWPIAKTDVVT